jgi:hypothetical protein
MEIIQEANPLNLALASVSLGGVIFNFLFFVFKIMNQQAEMQAKIGILWQMVILKGSVDLQNGGYKNSPINIPDGVQVFVEEHIKIFEPMHKGKIAITSAFIAHLLMTEDTANVILDLSLKTHLSVEAIFTAIVDYLEKRTW